MISLEELHKAPALLRNPLYRRSMEIVLGRRKGKIHSDHIWKTLQKHHLVDSNRKPTLIGRSALDSQ